MAPQEMPVAREGIVGLMPSRIREIANAGMGRSDIAAFWFGEGDQPTPQHIRDAAARSLAAGETFYTQNLGRPALRAALARYVGDLHGAQVSSERLVVTGSGVSALMLASQMVVAPGDRVAMVTPIWPNIAEIPRILGAAVDRVPLAVQNGRWTLDLDRLIDALTPQTRMVVINSPANPTGWTIDADDQRVILEHCRRHGIWIIADDVYERLVYTRPGAVAPSFLRLAEPEDRLMSVNSFSKAWSMTGWRIGWIVAPEGLMADFAKVIEYNTSCVPEFVQQGALAALDPARAGVVPHLVADLAQSRRLLLDGLTAIDGVEAPAGDGAMYAFFRIEGRDDDMALARALVAEGGLGLAPGSAFGPEGAGWLRWCFASRPTRIADGLERLRRYLAR